MVVLLFLSLPLQAFAQAKLIPVPNSDFEDGITGWEFLTKTGDCGVTDKLASHGKHSLQILSTASDSVKVQSARIPCRGPKLLELHGKFLARWGYYLNLRLEQLGKDGQLITNAPPFMQGPFGMNGVWEELVGFRGVGPVWLTDRTTHVRIVLEGKPGQNRPMEVYFDDIQLFDLGAAATNQKAVSVRDQLREVIGRKTRIVWTRGDRDNGGILMGLDSEKGRERVIGREDWKCFNPCFTSDGNRILFSGPEEAVYVVDWNGKNLRTLVKGRHHFVLGSWNDPATGFDWVYVGDNMAAETIAEIKAAGDTASNDSALSVYRYRMDDPSLQELVWNRMPVNRRAQVGPGAKTLVGEFPWPNCGLAILPNGTFSLYGQGCNPNYAPDDSGRFFYLLGNHRQLRMLAPGGPHAGTAVLIHVNTMAGNLKDPRRAVWRPKWSNDVRFFTINSCDLAPGSDIYLGEFNEDFSGIKQWVRITESEEYDADGVAWIEPVREASPSRKTE